MSSDERKIRLNIAREIIADVLQDMCNESVKDISREMTCELSNINISLIVFCSKLK